MDVSDFLKATLPQKGAYFILRGLDRFKSQSVTTFEEIEELSKTHNTQNYFVAIGSYKDKNSRSTDNALYKRAFYMDIDTGVDKPYKDIQEAWSAVKDWIKKERFLPPTLLVKSGHGLHLYWSLSEDILAEHWLPAANALKDLAQNGGLAADHAVTSDVARVLRLPGTSNFKDPNAVVECKIVDGLNPTYYSFKEFCSKLPYNQPTNVATPFALPGMPVGGMSIPVTDNTPKKFAEVLNQCPSLRHERDTAGAEADYNKWFATINFLAFCEDGHEWVHTISKGHKSYTPAAADIHWNKILADKESGALTGATTCARFNDVGCKSCAGCPHWKDPQRGIQWSSPIKFGVPAPKPSSLPRGYYVTHSGTHRLRPDDEPEFVCDLRPVRMEKLWNKDMQEDVLLLTHEKGGDEYLIQFSAECLNDSSGALNKALARGRVALYSTEIRKLRVMLVAWYKQIQISNSKTVINQYGWTSGDGDPMFAVGDKLYESKTKWSAITPPDVNLSQIFQPKGSETRWRELVKRALQAEHIETEVIMAAAFAAPLVRFSGVTGCLMSAVSSKSGTGKTLALQLAQSVWGEPVRAMFSMNDTTNSVAKKLSIYNSLPAFWDELRIGNDKQGRAFIDFIYQCTQGREKSRMKADTSLFTSAPWCTMLVCASNHYLEGHLDQLDKHSEAGALRLFEFEVSPLDRAKMYNQSAFGDVRSNYGHIGPKYAGVLAKNVTKLEKWVLAEQDRLLDSIETTTDERFQIATASTIILGARLARQLGYVDFNVEGISRFMRNRIMEMQRSREEVGSSSDGVRSALGIVSDFFVAKADYTTVTDEWSVPGKTTTVTVKHPPAKDPVIIRRVEGGPENKGIIFSQKHFSEWVMTNQRGDPRNIVRELVDSGCIKKKLRTNTGMSAQYLGVQGQLILIPDNQKVFPVLFED